MKGSDDVLDTIIAFILIVAVVLPISWALLPYISEMQIQPYKQQLEQKDKEIAALKKQIARLQDEIEKWEGKYSKLKNETITKEDIQMLKQYINSTQMQVNLLSQKLEITNNNFVTAYNTYFYVFKFSIVLNFVLATYISLDLINLALFNTSLNMRIINKLRMVFKRSK